jgi:DNA-binding response OmpR family regulator
MPGKNGFDVLRWIQTANIKPIVIILSGSELPEDVAQCLSLGAHAYFKKSSAKADQEKMLAEVEALLRAESPRG